MKVQPKLKMNIDGNYKTPFLDKDKNLKKDKNGKMRGYIVIVEEDFRVIGRSVIDKNRSCTVSGTFDTLQKIIDSVVDGKGHLEGRILVQECTVSELMEEDNNLRKTYLGTEDYISTIGFQKAVEPYLKRAGKDGPVLKIDGDPIVSFKEYDRTGELEDVILQHNNVEEVAAYRLAKLNSKIEPSAEFDVPEEDNNIVKDKKVKEKVK